MGSVFVFTFKDILLYIAISFILAFIIGILSENTKKNFWIWAILNLLLTPLVGFIYLLIKMSSRN
jgi:hypothetical protein